MMKTIGFAWGPDFKPGYKLDTLEIVDIYQIMAFLLKIPPNMHDGSWDRYCHPLTSVLQLWSRYFRKYASTIKQRTKKDKDQRSIMDS